MPSILERFVSTPSVALLLTDREQYLMATPKLRDAVRSIDAGLAKYLELALATVDVSPPELVVGNDHESRTADVQFMLRLLPEGFAEFRGVTPSGRELTVDETMEMFCRAVVARRDGVEDEEALSTNVFFRFDLKRLHDAAALLASSEAAARQAVSKARARVRP
jgi:hypothetical protein